MVPQMVKFSKMDLSKFFVYLIPILTTLTAINCQYEDVRCKCICPSPSVVSDSSPEIERKLYIDNVPPSQCNCDSVVLSRLDDPLIHDKSKEFCPLCECKYESRNVTTIKWVVIFIIGVVSCLVVYMVFLMLLDPFLHKSTRNAYQEQINEEVSLEEPVAGTHLKLPTSPTDVYMHPQSNVLNRVNQQQTKWKKQVQEQRKNIYDRHTMLN